MDSRYAARPDCPRCRALRHRLGALSCAPSATNRSAARRTGRSLDRTSRSSGGTPRRTPRGRRGHRRPPASSFTGVRERPGAAASRYLPQRAPVRGQHTGQSGSRCSGSEQEAGPHRVDPGRARAGRRRGAQRPRGLVVNHLSDSVSVVQLDDDDDDGATGHSPARCWSATSARHRVRRSGPQARVHHHRAPRQNRRRAIRADHPGAAAPTSGCSMPAAR